MSYTGLYILDEMRVPNAPATTSTFNFDLLSSFHLKSLSSSFYIWNSRLGHVFASRLMYLPFSVALEKLQINNILDCRGYKLAKIFNFTI